MVEALCHLAPSRFTVKSPQICKNEAQETQLQTQRGQEWVGFDGTPWVLMSTLAACHNTECLATDQCFV